MTSPFIALPPEELAALPPTDWTGRPLEYCTACTMAPCECVTGAPHAPVRRARVGSLVDPATVAFERPEWIKRDWYPSKVATLISGRGGSGKSSLTLADIAAGSRGELRGRRTGKPVRTIIVSVEDSQGMQRARLRAAGADERYYRFFTVTDAASDEDVIPAIPGDLPELERLAGEFQADLIVVDPLSSVVRGNLDKAPVIREALDPLTKIARNLNAAVVVIHHHKKGGGTGADLASGSHAIRDVVRSSILVAQDKETGERVLTFDKSNYSTLEGTSLGFDLVSVDMVDDEGVTVFDDEGNPETVAVAVVTGPVEQSVEEIVNRDPGGGVDERTAVDEARDWLEDELTREPGQARKDIIRAARKMDIGEPAIKRAATKLRVVSKPEGFPRTTYWYLPSVSSSTLTHEPTETAETTETTELTVDNLHVYKNGVSQSAQSAQSSQSDQSEGSEPTGEPTGVTMLCVMCDQPAAPDTAFCADHISLETA